MFKKEYPKLEREILPLPKYDIPQSVADTKKALKEFGWYPKNKLKRKIQEWIKPKA